MKITDLNIRFRQNKSGRISKGIMETLGIKTGDYIYVKVDRQNETVSVSPTTEFDPNGVRIMKINNSDVFTSASVFNKIFESGGFSGSSVVLDFEIDEETGELIHYKNQE